MEQDFEREIKVLVVGNGGVGKTSMIRRFSKGDFTHEYKKTIGVDFMEKVQYIPSLGEDVKLMLWDTAGQEEFDSITRTYYRGAGAAVLTFSTTDRASFEALSSWKDKVQAECGDIAMVLVQNKVDLLDQAQVSSEEAEQLARRLQLKFYRACVKENLNVGEVFTYLVELHNKKAAAGGPRQAHATATIATTSSVKAMHTAPGDDAAESPAINLKPAKQRTGGKKPLTQRFLDCSIG
ncbi:hypothetical protein WJX72_010475 [[Myrmecia] bisecta]|uniref:Ras-related protein Rab-23 n=1 Tax=[Myrmecia] bisecta TaxID=41462 RepID=A0AAW1QSJ5_9CHLO